MIHSASKMFDQIQSSEVCLEVFKLTVAACFLLVPIAVSAAQSAAPEITLTSNSVYEKNCAKCHGKTAEGRHFGGPSLLNEKVSASPAEDLHNIIANGKGRMPKYANKLSAEEIDTLVQQIKAQQIKAGEKK